MRPLWRVSLDSSFLHARSAFGIGSGYLDNARRHPIPLAAAKAVGEYAAGLATLSGPAINNDLHRDRVRSQFADLINASPIEIAIVSSTVAAENMVLRAMGLPTVDGGIVTDRLHYGGSLYMYEALRRRGFPVTIVAPDVANFSLDRYADALTPGTRLLAISLVSASTGFHHDLAALTALAHERGVLVYADIIQAAGAIDFDVQASGVDFCACSSYKWLLGDMGAAFLYVAARHLPDLERPVYGGQQIAWRTDPHAVVTPVYDGQVEWTDRGGARSLFEIETTGMSGLIAVSRSLELMKSIGLAPIEAHRAPLLARLRDAFAGMGLRVITPADARSPILSVAYPGAQARLYEPLRAAGVVVSLYPSFFRVSPSFFNDMGDVDALIDAVGRALATGS